MKEGCLDRGLDVSWLKLEKRSAARPFTVQKNLQCLNNLRFFSFFQKWDSLEVQLLPNTVQLHAGQVKWQHWTAGQALLEQCCLANCTAVQVGFVSTDRRSVQSHSSVMMTSPAEPWRHLKSGGSAESNCKRSFHKVFTFSSPLLFSQVLFCTIKWKCCAITCVCQNSFLTPLHNYHSTFSFQHFHPFLGTEPLTLFSNCDALSL